MSAKEKTMPEQVLEQILREGLAMRELSADENTLRRFRIYYDNLEAYNRVMNLTAITGEADAARLHFLDCAALLDAGDLRGRTLIDVGTGAGFPGLVLKIAFPEAKVTLFDSQKKRLLFLEEVIDALGLKGAETVHGRAEDYGHDPAYREKYDLAVSRAVANMSVLTEYCLPFVKKGGYFAAYKTADCGEEIAAAEGAVQKLGGVIKDRVSFLLPGTEIGRCLILMQHEKATPGKYPRKAGQPSKDPLK